MIYKQIQHITMDRVRRVFLSAYIIPARHGKIRRIRYFPKRGAIVSKDIVVEELNTLLRGQYMGIRSFEHYIQKLDDGEMRRDFQRMQQEMKENAARIAERIQNLGGVAADDEGVSGSMHSFMHKLTIPDDPQGIVRDALHGTDDYGVHYAEELIKGDLDPESRKIAEQVIDGNRKQAERLRGWLGEPVAT